jgi:hypothetical protein
MTLSEDIEPLSHSEPRIILALVMQQNGYDVIPGYYIHPKWKCGIPINASVVAPLVEDEYYHEFDLRCKKKFDNGLTEEIYIEIGGSDTRHEFDDDGEVTRPLKSSKYIWKKQKGNDSEAEQWLHMISPDAIVIRPNKEDIMFLGDSPQELFIHIKDLCRKYINDFITEKSCKKL